MFDIRFSTDELTSLSAALMQVYRMGDPQEGIAAMVAFTVKHEQKLSIELDNLVRELPAALPAYPAVLNEVDTLQVNRTAFLMHLLRVAKTNYDSQSDGPKRQAAHETLCTITHLYATDLAQITELLLTVLVNPTLATKALDKAQQIMTQNARVLAGGAPDIIAIVKGLHQDTKDHLCARTMQVIRTLDRYNGNSTTPEFLTFAKELRKVLGLANNLQHYSYKPSEIQQLYTRLMSIESSWMDRNLASDSAELSQASKDKAAVAFINASDYLKLMESNPRQYYKKVPDLLHAYCTLDYRSRDTIYISMIIKALLLARGHVQSQSQLQTNKAKLINVVDVENIFVKLLDEYFAVKILALFQDKKRTSRLSFNLPKSQANAAQREQNISLVEALEEATLPDYPHQRIDKMSRFAIRYTAQSGGDILGFASVLHTRCVDGAAQASNQQASASILALRRATQWFIVLKSNDYNSEKGIIKPNNYPENQFNVLRWWMISQILSMIRPVLTEYGMWLRKSKNETMPAGLNSFKVFELFDEKMIFLEHYAEEIYSLFVENLSYNPQDKSMSDLLEDLCSQTKFLLFCVETAEQTRMREPHTKLVESIKNQLALLNIFGLSVQKHDALQGRLQSLIKQHLKEGTKQQPAAFLKLRKVYTENWAHWHTRATRNAQANLRRHLKAVNDRLGTDVSKHTLTDEVLIDSLVNLIKAFTDIPRSECDENTQDVVHGILILGSQKLDSLEPSNNGALFREFCSIMLQDLQDKLLENRTGLTNQSVAHATNSTTLIADNPMDGFLSDLYHACLAGQDARAVFFGPNHAFILTNIATITGGLPKLFAKVRTTGTETLETMSALTFLCVGLRQVIEGHLAKVPDTSMRVHSLTLAKYTVQYSVMICHDRLRDYTLSRLANGHYYNTFVAVEPFVNLIITNITIISAAIIVEYAIAGEYSPSRHLISFPATAVFCLSLLKDTADPRTQAFGLSLQALLDALIRNFPNDSNLKLIHDNHAQLMKTSAELMQNPRRVFFHKLHQLNDDLDELQLPDDLTQDQVTTLCTELATDLESYKNSSNPVDEATLYPRILRCITGYYAIHRQQAGVTEGLVVGITTVMKLLNFHPNEQINPQKDLCGYNRMLNEMLKDIYVKILKDNQAVLKALAVAAENKKALLAAPAAPTVVASTAVTTRPVESAVNNTESTQRAEIHFETSSTSADSTSGFTTPTSENGDLPQEISSQTNLDQLAQINQRHQVQMDKLNAAFAKKQAEIDAAKAAGEKKLRERQRQLQKQLSRLQSELDRSLTNQRKQWALEQETSKARLAQLEKDFKKKTDSLESAEAKELTQQQDFLKACSRQEEEIQNNQKRQLDSHQARLTERQKAFAERLKQHTKKLEEQEQVLERLKASHEAEYQALDQELTRRENALMAVPSDQRLKEEDVDHSRRTQNLQKAHEQELKRRIERETSRRSRNHETDASYRNLGTFLFNQPPFPRLFDIPDGVVRQLMLKAITQKIEMVIVGQYAVNRSLGQLPSEGEEIILFANLDPRVRSDLTDQFTWNGACYEKGNIRLIVRCWTPTLYEPTKDMTSLALCNFYDTLKLWSVPPFVLTIDGNLYAIQDPREKPIAAPAVPPYVPAYTYHQRQATQELITNPNYSAASDDHANGGIKVGTYPQ